MKNLALCLGILLCLLPASLGAGGVSEPAAETEGGVVEFNGRLEMTGSMPHLNAIIRLEDGRVFLVDPAQVDKLPYGTGSYHFKARLSPPRKALPGLGIPRHDQVAHIVSATEIFAH